MARPVDRRRWEAVAAEAASCRRCPLWKCGTVTVFGEGPVPADVMLVGEQPGDVEDREGRPFVGPAGKLLDRCLEDVGVDRAALYLTNAVKHFKWEPRGKRRLHKKPDRDEVEACHPWLTTEVELVRPRLVLLMGATAAQASLGSSFKVTQQRGLPVTSNLAEFVVATVHPSSILRARDRRADAQRAFVDDLRAAFALVD